MLKNKITIAALAMLVTCFSTPYVMANEYGDILMDTTLNSMKKAGVKPVQFPHWFHRIRYKCKVCHESVFKMKRGSNNVSMKNIMDGKACGTCHNGLIAWEPLYCDRCHTAEPKPIMLPPKAKK